MKYVRLVDVVDGTNGDGDPIISYHSDEELDRLIVFVNDESDGRYIISHDVFMSTVDEWITDQREILEENKRWEIKALLLRGFS
jgi:hypothetical protein